MQFKLYAYRQFVKNIKISVKKTYSTHIRKCMVRPEYQIQQFFFHLSRERKPFTAVRVVTIFLRSMRARPFGLMKVPVVVTGMRL